ncbi:hypothetical protein CALCODRAFT_484512 [Calocera cornea HHB12733]|uniref:NACHT domain-containing protein n=1 Tax=Calocera cornea HHB12733 TaxID=1353952 RepID=A0A165EXT7_9BASI|nr:hypothetical protein CALCODRAFT_484512 [Calocera cornea HHB12733]
MPTYTLTCASVQCLTRGVSSGEGKYVLALILASKEVCKTQEVWTKESTAAWVLKGQSHTLGSKAQGKSISEPLWTGAGAAGHGDLSLSDWLKDANGVPLVPSTWGKSKSTLRLKLSLSPVAATVATQAPAPAPDPLRTAIDSTTASAATLRTLPGLKMLNATIGKVQEVQSSNMYGEIEATESVWEPLLEGVEAFIKVMDGLAEMAWTVSSAAYKIVKAQQTRDAKLQLLVKKMHSVYDFLLSADKLKGAKVQALAKGWKEVLAKLSMQTVECGHFISSYASFDGLLTDFNTGSQLLMEIATVHILADIQDLTVDMDICNIPYINGAGYELGKRCLPGTRSGLLDKLTDWASTDAPTTPRLFVLLGPAGTGKPAIAHTIAGRFANLKQLGLVFRFSSSKSAMRKPESLFRNMAHNLCEGRPDFKSALATSIAGNRSRFGVKDLEAQFESFIRDPAKMLNVNGTIVIVIDALDESGTPEERERLIGMLAQRLKDLLPAFRFLITAREEHNIQDTFPELTREMVVKRMSTLQGDASLSTDVLQYVCHTLSEMDGTLLCGLPTESCDTLATKSEGIFQWAFVACRYIKVKRMGQTSPQRYQLLAKGGDTGLDSLKEYFIEAAAHHEQLATASLRLLKIRLHFNMGKIKSSYTIKRRLKPAFRAKPLADELVYAQNLLFWINAASVAGQLSMVVTCITSVMKRLEKLGDDLLKMARDGIEFIRVFGQAILDSPVHIYISALPWVSSGSLLAKTYGPKYLSTAVVATGRPASWPSTEITITKLTPVIGTVAFAPDGMRIASLGRQGRNYPNINSIAFLPDGRQLVSGSKDHTVRIWDTVSGRLVGKLLTGHENEVNCVAFVPNGTQVASASNDMTIQNV